jgi:hypothetical protein
VPRASLPVRIAPWAVLLAVLAQGWDRWPDVIVDWGREMYLAWRIAEGDRLYRDVESFNGPLSPHLNALVLAIFGTGIRTLVAANILWLVLFTFLLHRLLRAAATPAAASLGTSAFTALCASSALIGIGNFNWVTPYAHDATHGLVLSVAAVLLLIRHRQSGSRTALAGAALLTGAVLLTKMEVSVALLGTVAVALLLPSPRPDPRQGPRIAAFAILAALPPCLAFLVLARGGAARHLAGALLVPWRGAFSPELRRMPFYAFGLGLAAPGRQLALMAAQAIALALLLGLAAALDQKGAGVPTAALAAAPFVLAGFFAPPEMLLAGIPALPLVVAFAAFRAAGDRRGGYARADALLLAAVFSGLLLLKLGLAARVHQYGFALAAPAVALGAAFLFDRALLPGGVGRQGPVGRAVVAGLVVCSGLLAFRQSGRIFAMKQVLVDTGRPADEFLADSRAKAVLLALQELRPRLAQGRSLVGLPQGGIFYYLSRTRAAIPFATVLPPEEALFGHERLVGAILRAEPDLLVIHSQRLEEYGAPGLGRGFLPELRTRLFPLYRPVFLAGSDPFRNDGFGVMVLERDPAARAPAAGTP